MPFTQLKLNPALLHAIELARRGDHERARRIVLVTDGAVSNEDDVFAAVEARPHPVRLQDRDEDYWLLVGRVASDA